VQVSHRQNIGILIFNTQVKHLVGHLRITRFKYTVLLDGGGGENRQEILRVVGYRFKSI